MNARLFRPSLLVVAVATALAGCGGGGHSSNNNGGGSTGSGLNVTSQPKSTTAAVGSSATFSVTVSGSNVSYQWYKNSTAISGATSSTYTTPALTDADDGAAFFVIAKNDSGSVKSDTITLTLGVAGSPTITGQPANQTAPLGGSATFTVIATGTSLTYQWYKGSDKISGATQSSYTVSSITSSSAGTYHVVVTNANGSVTSADATLTIGAAVAPAITTQPASQTVKVGATATFSVVASGSGPLTYQWYYNGSQIAGATSSSYSVTTTASSGGGYYVIVTNSVGTAQSNTATLTVLTTPVITQQPTSATVFSTQTVTLTVVATGGNLSYQWYKDGTAISGATSATYTFTAQSSPSNAGTYKVVVSNVAGSVSSSSVTVTVQPAPTITTQPANVSVGVGSTATFTVGATGSGLTFQWYKNGAAVSGATSTSYTTPATVQNDSGATFYCVVSNPAGSATSNSATLTVVPKPVITAQPTSKTVSSGQTATFTVTANSPNSKTLTYAWYKVGSTTVLNTTASYVTPATDSSYNGNQYYVVVTNDGVATIQSDTVTLTVQ